MRNVYRLMLVGLSVCTLPVLASQDLKSLEEMAAARRGQALNLTNPFPQDRVPQGPAPAPRPWSDAKLKQHVAIQEQIKLRRLGDSELRTQNPDGTKRELFPNGTKENQDQKPVFNVQRLSRQARPGQTQIVPRSTTVTKSGNTNIELKWNQYYNNMDYVYNNNLYLPEAEYISLHFDRVDLEDGHDFVYIMYRDDFGRWQTCDYFTGFHTDFWSNYCPSNYLEVWVYTDYSVNGFDSWWNGFEIDEYVYTYTLPNQDPVPLPVVSQTAVSFGTPIYFNGDGSYDTDAGDSVTDFRWKFGDGQESLNSNEFHTYAAPGSYLVSLEVWDKTDGYAITTFWITVDKVAVPINARAAWITDSAVTFEWDKGGTNNAGYIVDFDEGDGSNLSCASSQYSYDNRNEQSVFYDDLKPNTSYTFIVCAYDSNWTTPGDPWVSEKAIVHVTTSKGSPQAFSISGIRKLPDGNYEISFVAPEAGRTYELEKRLSVAPGASWGTAIDANRNPVRGISARAGEVLIFKGLAFPQSSTGLFRVKAIP